MKSRRRSISRDLVGAFAAALVTTASGRNDDASSAGAGGVFRLRISEPVSKPPRHHHDEAPKAMPSGKMTSFQQGRILTHQK
jgi:hypothetical protein